MFQPPRPGALRLALLASSFALALAGAAMLAGCSDSGAAPGVGASVQTTDALALLPADADVMGMMNLRAARQSDALDAALGDTGFGMVGGDGSDDFEELMRLTGFDPGEDLDRVYVAGSHAPGGPERAAFVAYGRFDRERIERYLADQGDPEVVATDIEGVPTYVATDADGDSFGFALANAEMVLAGDLATLTAMVGRLGRTGAATDAGLQSLLDRVMYPDGAWFVVRNLPQHLADVPEDAPEPALAARAADAVVMSMDFRTRTVPVRAFLVSRADAPTDDVADVVRGALSAAKMGLKDRPAALDVLDRTTVETESDGVRIDAVLTPEFFASTRP